MITTFLKYESMDSFLSDIEGAWGFILPILEIVWSFLVTPFYNSSRIDNAFNFHRNIDNNEKISNLINNLILNK